MKVTCNEAPELVPRYLDGELSESLASPLRAHLLDCQACREVAMEGRALERWFEAGAPELVAVPAGFAARVARRAFAGDPGLLVPVEPPSLARRRPLLPVLLLASAVAAVLLFVLALAIQRESLPSSNGLDAQSRPPWLQSGGQSSPTGQGEPRAEDGR
jgi:anti-sigma factor RsiW